ncbi:MAG: hypothetical protein IJY08_02635 [Clostridia bacterium]|nr:hypothetical protein [Clostridia bacterium]
MKSIVNIVNFVRAVEPRPGRNIDLKKPVAEQIRLMKELGLRGTFLLQYDALISPEFVQLMSECRDFAEVGLWLEIVQPQVEAAGGVWKGRYPWDWYNDVGFLIGYEPGFRKALIDVAMDKYRELYGKYPDSVGSWHIDAVSMRYLAEKYGVSACCICRDQVGTDGYTMQGGYYNQAYYPSVNNMFCPASGKDTQINMPVFRMLGSDPILAYDYQIFRYDSERCPTLEPAQRGSNSRWCDWFFDEVMAEGGLCFRYAQTGQENSFGWDRMKNGTEYQFPLIKKLADQGKIDILTLGESGKWFKDSFELTPPATMLAQKAWDGNDLRSVWYSSRYYRANILWDHGVVRLRDLYLFDDRYKEHYVDTRCDTHACEFRNLPVMDGAIYSTSDLPAGIYLTDGVSPIRWDSMSYEESDSHAAITLTSAGHSATVTFGEAGVSVSSDIPSLSLTARFDRDRAFGSFDTADEQFANHNNSKANITYISRAHTDKNEIFLTFDGFEYSLKATKGEVRDFFDIASENGDVELCFPHAEKNR